MPAPDPIDNNITLLDAGQVFRGYTIRKMMNKDSEGIKYIAEKDGREFVLKVFYKSSFSNMNTLFNLQMRLSRLNNLKQACTAKVAEVNQNHSPAYMAVEFVHGISFADMKKSNPERITEDLVRKIAPKLVNAAIEIRKHGLTISNATLSSLMLTADEEPVVLSSGITYEEVDEREDVFTLGMIFAQMLSRNSLYKSIYSADRLRNQKFINVGGVSMSLNKTLSECLHRNIIQRFVTLSRLQEAISKLPPLESDEICQVQERGNVEEVNSIDNSAKPRMRMEYGFWILLIAVIGILVLIFTTNIYSVLFGAKGDKLQYTGFNLSSTEADTIETIPSTPGFEVRNAPARTEYGDLKSTSREDSPDFRKVPPSPLTNTPATQPVVQRARPTANMVFVEAGTLGFGRLTENLAHNVSVSGFYIGKNEVTQAEWNRFMKPANVSTVGDNLPVDNVSWFDIAIYCNGRSESEGLNPAYKIRGVGASRVVTCDFKANGYRLPTEAEWELAAKAGELNSYSGSNDPADVAWYRDNSAGKIRTPGGKTPNALGLYDMTGNVSEWCWDWYDANYLKALPTFINPTGPQTGTQKSIRGGNIINGEGRNLNILWREKGDPNKGYQFVGFRLVRSS